MRSREARHLVCEVVKLLSNFFRRNETDRRLSVGIITPYKGQVELITDMIYGNRSTAGRLPLKPALIRWRLGSFRTRYGGW